MSKHKINIDRPELSAGEIQGTQHFDQVLQSYGKLSMPFYKTFTFWGSAVVVAAATTAAVLFYPGDNTGEVRDGVREPATEMIQPLADNNFQSMVHPPFDDMDIPFTTYQVQAEEGGYYIYETGSAMEVPANAFVDKDGNPVLGEVELQYREFHNPVEFFLSGIPMEFDSAGVNHTFESAGMMELRAFKDGEEVFLAKGKPVQMSMRSSNDDAAFNLYALNEATGNWENNGKSEILKKPLFDDDADFAETPHDGQQMKIIPKQDEGMDLSHLPLEPKAANKSNYKFSLDIDPSEYPELAIYQDMLWEVDANDANFDKTYMGVTWEGMTLKKGQQAGDYTLTLSKADTAVTFGVYPVFNQQNYAKAKAAYDAKYEVYQQQKQQQQQQGNATASNLKKRTPQEKALAQAEWEKRNVQFVHSQRLAQANADEVLRSAILRTFPVSVTGIHNIDFPYEPRPRGAQVIALYTDSKGRRVEAKDVFLVEGGKNSIYRYQPTEKLRYNPRSKNLLWVVLVDGQMGVFTPAQFEQLDKKADSFEFELQIGDKVSAINWINKIMMGSEAS